MKLEFSLTKRFIQKSHHFEFSGNAKIDKKNVVIWGQSGAGKSIFLKMLAGLIKPDSGFIRLNEILFFDHQNTFFLSPQNRNLGYLFQDFALFPHLNIQQNIAFGIKNGFLNPPKNRVLNQEVDEILYEFELKKIAKLYPNQLSGGQKQRTALARAIITKPKLLLLDEPFSSLDFDLKQKMRQNLRQLQKKYSIPILLISHEKEDLDYFGEQILFIKNGKITQFNS